MAANVQADTDKQADPFPFTVPDGDREQRRTRGTEHQATHHLKIETQLAA